MFLAAFFSLATAVAAPATVADCLKITDSLDRKYCLDKNLQTTKTQFAAEQKTWTKGLTGDAKTARAEALQTDVEAKREYINHLQAEIGLNEKQLADLNAVTVTAPAKKKKKEKKKSGFRIKL
jgi:hypothetical protein